MSDGDTLSSILGWISVGCWILVYSPQIYENYSIQSGEGLSLLFLLSWLVGDLCNLVGAIVGGLVATVTTLAIYFLACDFILTMQVLYYRWKRSWYPVRLRPMYDLPSLSPSTTSFGDDVDDDDDVDVDGELEPLLRLTKVTTDAEVRRDGTLRQLLVKYVLCLIFVTVLGIGAWWFDQGRYGNGEGGRGDWSGGHGNSWPGSGDWGDEEWLKPWVVQGLGCTSAFLYIFGHFPQLFKNCTTRCEGLAPELFVFSTFGNVAYVLSVLAKSTEKDYLIAHSSWLVGQGLTAVMDALVVGQIIYYRSMKRESIPI